MNYLIFILLFFIPISGFASSGNVVFSEIQWMGTTKSSSDEWIELKNNSDLDMNLEGWTLKSEDGTPDISLNGIIKGNSYFLLERTDDNSAYQVEGDLFYSGALGNGGEKLLLINGDGEIIDFVDKKDNGDWQSGDSSARKSMLKDENGIWINGDVDGSPCSGKAVVEIDNREIEDNQDNGKNSEAGFKTGSANLQNGQNGQKNIIENILFDFQSPSYVSDKTENLSEYICDKSKDECKINFNFEKTFENLLGGLKKSDYYCQINFGSLSTGQENRCNPNTVIFPIGETNILVKIFKKSSSIISADTGILKLEKNILIKNLELSQVPGLDNNNLNSSYDKEVLVKNSPGTNILSKKQDLSIKNGIFKNKFRIKSISLNETDGDFVEIFCLNCDKKINIGGYKIYSSKNFFHFPIQKFGKYDLKNKKTIKIFLKKNCQYFEKNKIENNQFEKNINDSLDKNDKSYNQDFCTNKKTGLVSTNGSLFFMNSNGEIVDSVCWQNGKDIKGKTQDEINILKNNNLWLGECLNTASLKKGDVFEREIFSGYNSSKSWKKFNIGDLLEEEFLEIEKDKEKDEQEINPGTINQETVESYEEIKNLENSPGTGFVKSDLQTKLEKTREQKTFFNKKTKFHKIYLPKKKSRIFRFKGRTLPFVKIEFLSENGEFFETISDGEGYFKIYFDKLKKGEKKIHVKFFQNGEKIFQKNLNFFLVDNWESSEYKKKSISKIETGLHLKEKGNIKSDIEINTDFDFIFNKKNKNNNLELNLKSVHTQGVPLQNINKKTTFFQNMILKKDYQKNSSIKISKNTNSNGGLKLVKNIGVLFNKFNNFFGFDF